ncbi:hypothetical protein NMY22_g13699 [Coprinellus aureogranulatus]|nr:hypothetical protein NMY22_g13699 [Coprinellus aureogranulatus]
MDGDVDEESLKNFSLTSSAFRIPCQTILFSYVRITYSTFTPTGRKSPGERLLELLSSSPAIPSNVKQVSISDMRKSSKQYWMQNDEKLGEALEQIDPSQVQVLKLQRTGILPSNWSYLPDQLRNAITHICRSPVLRELCLWGVPLDLVNHCGSSLKHLTVYDCHSVELLDTPQRSSECVLDSLKVYDWLHLDMIVTLYLLNPSSRVRVECLHTLHVKISGASDHIAIFALIKSCRSSLKSFILEPGTNVDSSDWTGDMDPLSIRNCPNLTSLHLKANAEQPDRVRHFVAYVPPSDSLQEVYLDLSFHLAEFDGSWCSERTSALHTIGNNVAHEPHFPQLKALRVRICIPNLPEDGIRIVHEWAMRELSAPHERNFLQLSVSPSKFRKDFQSKMNTDRHAIL